MVEILKYSVIFVAAMAGLTIAFVIGPLSKLSPAIQVNGSYLNSLQHHYYFFGLVAGVFACILAYIIKANLKLTAVVLFVAGIFWGTYSQSGDPEFLQYSAGTIVEFMVPYMSVNLIVILLTLGINKKWPRLS